MFDDDSMGSNDRFGYKDRGGDRNDRRGGGDRRSFGGGDRRSFGGGDRRGGGFGSRPPRDQNRPSLGELIAQSSDETKKHVDAKFSVLNDKIDSLVNVIDQLMQGFAEDENEDDNKE